MVFWLEQFASKLRYAAIVWYHLTVIQIHPLHRPNSIFAGMLMFTEIEVVELKRLSQVSTSSLVDWLIYNPLQSELELAALKDHYNSYLADGISIYNPVSIMSAFEQAQIDNFWIATGLLVAIIFVLHPTE